MKTPTCLPWHRGKHVDQNSEQVALSSTLMVVQRMVGRSMILVGETTKTTWKTWLIHMEVFLFASLRKPLYTRRYYIQPGSIIRNANVALIELTMHCIFYSMVENGLCAALSWYSMDYPTCHLYSCDKHTGLKACLMTEKIRVTREILIRDIPLVKLHNWYIYVYNICI